MPGITIEEQQRAATEKFPIAGFWRRVAAFIIDGSILGLPLFIIGLIFFQWVTDLGQAGRLIGFFVMLVYFGYFDSSFGGGQTLGKRLLDIKLVDRLDNTLSPIRAILRFMVIGIPYFLNGIWINDSTLTAWQQHVIAVPITFLVFGCGSAIIYLFIFNRRTRQSLHDLAVGSFVVRCSAAGSPITLFTPRLHVTVSSCFLLLALALPIISSIKINNDAMAQSKSPLLDLQNAIKTRLGIQRVEISESNMTLWSVRGGASTQSYLVVQVQPSGWKRSSSTLMQIIARTVIDHSPDLLGKHVLSIRVHRGFNLGIASWSENSDEAHDEATWLSKIPKSSNSTKSL